MIITLSDEWDGLEDIARTLSQTGHNVSYAKLYQYCYNHHIPVMKEGRYVKVRWSDLADMPMTISLETLVGFLNSAARSGQENGRQEVIDAFKKMNREVMNQTLKEIPKLAIEAVKEVQVAFEAEQKQQDDVTAYRLIRSVDQVGTDGETTQEK